MSTVRLRRLTADANHLQQYVKSHPRLRMIQTHGDPPERYQIEYRIKCLRQVGNDLEIVKSHVVEIYLPKNYPRTPPQCRMLSPVFHPNIAPHAICVGDHWSAGESLHSIVTRIGEMLAYQSYNVKSPLNGEAARWVQEHVDELPLDKVSMLVDESKAAMSDASVDEYAPPVTQPPPLQPPPLAPSNSMFLAKETTTAENCQPLQDFPNGEFFATVDPVAESIDDEIWDTADVFESTKPSPISPPPPQFDPLAPRTYNSRPPAPKSPASLPAAPSITDSPEGGDKMQVFCPSCNKRSVVPKSAAGRKAKCLRCETPFRIPSS